MLACHCAALHTGFFLVPTHAIHDYARVKGRLLIQICWLVTVPHCTQDSFLCPPLPFMAMLRWVQQAHGCVKLCYSYKKVTSVGDYKCTTLKRKWRPCLSKSDLQARVHLKKQFYKQTILSWSLTLLDSFVYMCTDLPVLQFARIASGFYLVLQVWVHTSVLSKTANVTPADALLSIRCCCYLKR